jgi:hypothetical protein
MSLSACSSSSSPNAGDAGNTGSAPAALGGSAVAKTCTNTTLNHPSTAADDRCNTCNATQCVNEANAFLGSDPNAFGGACGAEVQCSCLCAASDKTCLAACEPKISVDCYAALGAAKTCESEKCAADCPADAASDGGAADGS